MIINDTIYYSIIFENTSKYNYILEIDRNTGKYLEIIGRKYVEILSNMWKYMEIRCLVYTRLSSDVLAYSLI